MSFSVYKINKNVIPTPKSLLFKDLNILYVKKISILKRNATKKTMKCKLLDQIICAVEGRRSCGEGGGDSFLNLAKILIT